jgi:hypothetical protein
MFTLTVKNKLIFCILLLSICVPMSAQAGSCLCHGGRQLYNSQKGRSEYWKDGHLQEICYTGVPDELTCNKADQSGSVISTVSNTEYDGCSFSATVDCDGHNDKTAAYTPPAPVVPTTPAAGTTDPLKDLLIKSPGISIKIPGLDFTNINKPDENGYLYIPWIAEYMTALYKFLIGIVSIVAVVMIIIQGARVVTSGGGDVKMDAYKKIFRAVIGLVIAWGSYAILYNVNPDLVKFNALKVLYIKEEPLPDISKINEDVTIDTGAGNSAASIVGLLNGPLPSSYKPCSQEAAMYAARQLAAMSICVGPCHCAWTASEFLKYIGCNIIHGNSPNQIKSKNPSWVEDTISASQWQSYPYVGVLITSGRGHAGVYLGSGWVFQSVEFNNGSPFSQKQNCPQPAWKVRTEDDKPKPENYCSSCAKLKGHEPWSGFYEAANVMVNGVISPNPGGKNGGTACVSSQIWRMDQKSNPGGWGYLLHPPS